MAPTIQGVHVTILAMTTTTRPAYLIPHTHWDREWYRTFQQFRLDLVRVVDGVLDTLESDPTFTHFMLDGQTIVLDDYLAIRPERAAQLRRHIADGRLGVGPWYCHPDLFLVSGEAIARNLMLGLRMARDYGRAMTTGYIPDQFGHTGQTPQILDGFGIGSAVLWRGVNARATHNESTWQASDGSAVFLEFLAGSYCNAQRLPLEPEALATRLRQLCNVLAATATGPGVLLMNGCDHLPVQAGLPTALAAANRLLEGEWRVEIASLDDAVERLRADGHPDGVTRGELRSSATAHLLPGVLSARIPQVKQRNARAQLLLEREAEPYAAWASLLGAAYPHGELWEAWRLLLQNQPHDSVCGCSIDQVHREMGARYDGAEQIGAELVARAAGRLIARIDTRLPGDATVSDEETTEAPIPVVVFNGGDGTRSERVKLTLELPAPTGAYALVDERGAPVAHAWTNAGGEPTLVTGVPRDTIPAPDVIMSQVEGNRMMGMGLQKLTMRVEDDGLHVEATVGENGIMSREEIEALVHEVHRLLAETDPAPVIMHVHHNERHELRLLARDVPARGYKTLWLRPTAEQDSDADGDGDAGATGTPSDPRTIESELFTVRADEATGALTLTDRRSGVVYGPCNVFIDGGDAGDSYTYAPPPDDTIVARPAAPPTITAARDALGASLTIKQELVVPQGLDEGRFARSAETTTLPIESVVTLTHGCPRVDIVTTLTNSAHDHRLRVAFDLPFATGHVHAEQAFDVVRRPIGIAADEAAVETPHEDPVPEAPQQGFVLAHAEGRGIMIASAGLPEYVATTAGETTTIALTLLRCVGWLSREDLPTRRGGAGPALETPEAQCLGTHTYAYSLIPLATEGQDDDWRGAIADAHHAVLPLRALTADPSAGELPASASFLSLDALGVVVSAIKGAEDGRGLVVRLYNPTDAPATGSLHLLWPVDTVERLNLDERTLETLHAGQSTAEVALDLAPHKIETLRLVLA